MDSGSGMRVLETARRLVMTTSPQALHLKPRVIFEDNTGKCFLMLSKYFVVVNISPIIILGVNEKIKFLFYKCELF